MTRYASMLRGLNVAGARKVPMAELRAVYESLGYEHVASHLQSGNVVFDAAGSTPDSHALDISSAVASAFGHDDVDVVVLDASELAHVVAGNPFADRDASSLHVTFLAGEPVAAALADIHGTVAGSDEIATGAGVVYVHCPHGYGRSKLNNAFIERALGVRATTRNWRTTLALLDLVS